MISSTIQQTNLNRFIGPLSVHAVMLRPPHPPCALQDQQITPNRFIELPFVTRLRLTKGIPYSDVVERCRVQPRSERAQ